MPRPQVDLSSHINETVTRGHPADFPVTLEPVYHECNGSYLPVPHRQAVVRTDTGQPLAVVSDRYRFVPHQEILDTVEQALAPLDVGPVPRGLFVDRQGARMRALYKFPALRRPVRGRDEICPCLKIQNTYDGTSRIAVHIGAFRFVCTNLTVGGGGVFAGGFMAVHAGEIPLDEVAEQLADYLQAFDAIVELYGRWAETVFRKESVQELLEDLPRKAAAVVEHGIEATGATKVYEAYNVATDYATHGTRSVRTAFEMLARINRGFQAGFPMQA